MNDGATPGQAPCLFRRSLFAFTDLGLHSTWLYRDRTLLHMHLAYGFSVERPHSNKNFRIAESTVALDCISEAEALL